MSKYVADLALSKFPGIYTGAVATLYGLLFSKVVPNSMHFVPEQNNNHYQANLKAIKLMGGIANDTYLSPFRSDE